jgi:predicted nucleotide-binding protein
MTALPLVDQDLVVHLFAPLSGPQAEQAYRDVRDIWQACSRVLGLTTPLGGPKGLPLDLADELGELARQPLLAGRETPDGVEQSLVRRHDDVLVFSLRLAQPLEPTPERAATDRSVPPRDPRRRSWGHLDQLWSAIVDTRDNAILGEARLYVATASSAGDIEASPEVAHGLAPALAPSPTDPRWPERGVTAPGGCAVWETSPRDDARARRRIVVLAPEGREPVVGAWLWTDHGHVHLPPFARYLMHAAKARYQFRVHESAIRRDELTARIARAERDLRSAMPDATAASELREVRERVRTLAVEENAIAAFLADVRTMRRTVEIAKSNMAAALAPYRPPEGAHLFADDHGLVSWLGEQLDDDATYLEIALQRATTTYETAKEVIVVDDSRGSWLQATPLERRVFVVHGRDEQLRRAMFELLRAIDLRPLEWEDLIRATGTTSPTLRDVVVMAPSVARATLVLLSPDDIVALHPDLHEPGEQPHETERRGQARPNVLVELGLALATSEDRTIVVEVGANRPITDLGGINTIRFNGTATAIGKIVERLKSAGCAVNDTGADWRDTKRFKKLAAYTRRPPDDDGTASV